MMYRTKSITVDAKPFHSDNLPWPEGVLADSAMTYSLVTPEGKHQVAEGDWIITFANGNQTNCKESEFLRVYEIAADEMKSVTPGAGYTITEETIAVASAIYWSWWRARDMHGEAP